MWESLLKDLTSIPVATGILMTTILTVIALFSIHSANTFEDREKSKK